MDDAGFKTCPSCGADKSLDDFAPRGPRRRQNQCRACRAEYNRGHYARNKAAYLERAAKRNKALYLEMSEKILAYLESHPCVKCGETDPVVLQFHHRDPSEKSFGLTCGASAWKPWDEVMAEIAKCDVLCANDHKRHHSKESNDYRYRAAVRVTG